MKNKTSWILSVSGGIVAALPWWGAPGLFLLICFVPLFFIEDCLTEGGEPVLSLLPFSFVFFLCWNLIVTWWIARIHLLGGMSVIILNTVFMSLVFLLYARIKRGAGGGPLVFVILWVAFEFLHYRGDLSWPWLTVGNGLAGNVRIIQWYEYTGASGGSFWVLLVNAMVFTLIRQFNRRGRVKANFLRMAGLLLLIVVPPAVSLSIFNSPEEKETGVGFLILQPGLDPYVDKYDGISNPERLDHLLALAASNMPEEARYVVTPETSVDSIRITDPGDKLSKRVYSFIEQYPGRGIIMGATSFISVPRKEKSYTTRMDQRGNYFDVYNSALFYYKGGPLKAYHKHYLANGVEQIPFQRVFGPLGRLSLDLGGVSGSMRRGEGALVFRSPLSDSLVMGTLICFESAYGEYAARFVRKGAEILIVISNDGWFKNTGAYRQHLRLSQIRAIENRRSIVRAANTGVSCHISQRGEITDRLGWWEEGTLFVKAKRNNRVTFYTLYGDYPGRISLFFSVLLVLNLLVRTAMKDRQGQ